MPCEVIDEQVSEIVKSIVLPEDWLDRANALISEQDETALIHAKHTRVNERLNRLARVYLDGLFPEDEYRRQKRRLETELESLVVPGIDAAKEAGNLFEEIPLLWDAATLRERRDILIRLLDGVYVDMRGSRSVVSIKPKPAFAAVLDSSSDGEELQLMTNDTRRLPLNTI